MIMLQSKKTTNGMHLTLSPSLVFIVFIPSVFFALPLADGLDVAMYRIPGLEKECSLTKQ